MLTAGTSPAGTSYRTGGGAGRGSAGASTPAASPATWRRRGRVGFRDDLKEARFLGISRFPTLVLGRPGGRSAALVGYRPWSALAEAIAQMSPELEPLVAQPPSADPLDYALVWGRVTAREAAEEVGIETGEAERRLGEAAEAGRLRRAGHLFLAAVEPVAPVDAAASAPVSTASS